MTTGNVSRNMLIAGAVALLAGCSGSTEDVRVTFCKNISTALVPEAESVEWTGNENTFVRPEYAKAALTFDVVDTDGKTTSMRTACYYEYDALEDTAQTLADPFSAHATLPFAMSVDGNMLSDAELVRLRNAEQIRQGKAVISALETGARDLAEKVRAGLGQ